MTAPKEKALVFAPLVRVSTERQDKQGESLRSQHKRLDEAVKLLGGKVHKWYEGQEHATADNGPRILEQLMTDAQHSRLDAIMVDDVTRWSRDNEKNKAYLKIFKAHGLRFFVGTREYDLYDPAQSFFIGMQTEVGEFQAKEQARKSMLNRIARAERGYPSAGRLPFGAHF